MSANVVPMKEPVCLIESDNEGKLRLVPSAKAILDQIEQQVVVVGVVGLYRTGKSYLMNKLAGAHKGFALGSTIQSKTKGIWMWCVPHPKLKDHTLILLDTEGLGDVEKGDERNDIWIFAMAVLLSSTLVYNSMGTIDNNALEKLHYVTELTEHIKVKSGPSREADDSEYMGFFPSFVWSVRDFTLELVLDGKTITADEYLENALKMKPGLSQKYNQPRYCLRNYFNPRGCFVFERPANSEKMRRMDEMTDEDLEPAFVQQAKEFCQHIYSKSRTKTLKDGIKVTGRLLGNMADTYVGAIRSGQVPCLDNAVLALAEIENSKAVEQARVYYVENMASRVTYPTETQDMLSEANASCLSEALSVFMKHSFKDGNQTYQEKLMELLQVEYFQICERNSLESQRVCESIIRGAFETMEEKLSSGYYTTPGGYNKYCDDLKMMTSQYRSAKGKGVKAEEVLKTYLDEKESTAQSIMAADKSLTEAEQRAAEERARSERMEHERQIMEENLLEQQRLAADQQRAHDENVKQMMEKMEKERKEGMAEFQRVLAAKDQEMAKFREQGFEAKALQLQKEIEMLKVQCANASRRPPSPGCTIL